LTTFIDHRHGFLNLKSQTLRSQISDPKSSGGRAGTVVNY